MARSINNQTFNKMRKFVIASFDEREANGRVQAIFRGKGGQMSGLINGIVSLCEEKYSNPRTRASYLVSELLDCTAISSNGEFFHSLNSKGDLLETIGDAERNLLQGFIEQNRDDFTKSKDQHVQNLMAGLYMIGFGVEKDEKKAVALYKELADQDYAPAQAALADCYERGIVVEKDKAKSVELYQLALANGYQEAANNIDIKSVSTYLDHSGITDGADDSTISSKKSASDDSTISSFDSKDSKISLPDIKRHPLVDSALRGWITSINTILRDDKTRNPKFRKNLEEAIEYIDNGFDGESFVADGKGLGAVLDKDNYLFLSRELRSPLKERIMNDYEREHAVRRSDDVINIQYNPRKKSEGEEPPLMPADMGNNLGASAPQITQELPMRSPQASIPEPSAPIRTQEEEYDRYRQAQQEQVPQARIPDPSAPSLHEELYKAAKNNNGKEGKSLIALGASIYDPIDHGVLLSENPLTLYAKNGRKKTVNNILSSPVTRDESRVPQLKGVVRYIETAGPNGESLVSGGLGSILDKGNAEFLKQNMDYDISKKIVTDYNNLRIMKRIEQVPVAVVDQIISPQEELLKRKEEPVKEDIKSTGKKDVAEVKNKSKVPEMRGGAVDIQFPEVPSNPVLRFPEVPSGGVSTSSAAPVKVVKKEPVLS